MMGDFDFFGTLWPKARKSAGPPVPTADEIAEYCRDADSVGCDIDMIETLIAQGKVREATAATKNPVWSADIDSAVKANTDGLW